MRQKAGLSHRGRELVMYRRPAVGVTPTGGPPVPADRWTDPPGTGGPSCEGDVCT